jgi:hypothetical protein
MKKPEILGISSFGDRRLYLLGVDRIRDVPRNIEVGSRYFVCVLAMEAKGMPDDDISNVTRGLVRSGCVYLCTWGPDCERVHDLTDSELGALEAGQSNATDVMTTWHDQDSLSEVLWYALNVAWPAGAFEDQCASTLVVVIGRPDWAETCRAALQDPDAFSKRVLAAEAL